MEFQVGPSSRPYTPPDYYERSHRKGKNPSRPSGKRRARLAAGLCVLGSSTTTIVYAAPLSRPTGAPIILPRYADHALKHYSNYVPPYYTYVSGQGWVQTDEWELNGRMGQPRSVDPDMWQDNDYGQTDSPPLTAPPSTSYPSKSLQSPTSLPQGWAVRHDRTQLYAVPLIVVASCILVGLILFGVLVAVFYRHKPDHRKRRRKTKDALAIAPGDDAVTTDDEKPQDEERKDKRHWKMVFAPTRKGRATRFRVRRVAQKTRDIESSITRTTTLTDQRTSDDSLRHRTNMHRTSSNQSAVPTLTRADSPVVQPEPETASSNLQVTLTQTSEGPSSSCRRDPLQDIYVPQHVDLPAYPQTTTSPAYSASTILSPIYGGQNVAMPHRSARQNEKARAIEAIDDGAFVEGPSSLPAFGDRTDEIDRPTAHIAFDEKAELARLDVAQSQPRETCTALDPSAPGLSLDDEGFELSQDSLEEPASSQDQQQLLPAPSVPVSSSYLHTYSASENPAPSAPMPAAEALEASAPDLDEADEILPPVLNLSLESHQHCHRQEHGIV